MTIKITYRCLIGLVIKAGPSGFMGFFWATKRDTERTQLPTSNLQMAAVSHQLPATGLLTVCVCQWA